MTLPAKQQSMKMDAGGRIAGFRREPPGSQPVLLHEPYLATVRRAPRRPLVLLPHTLSEITGPVYGHEDISETDHDLTRQHHGEPLGERIIVSGRLLDDNGRPVPHGLIELWQANVSRSHCHVRDDHLALLRPN